MVELEIKKKYEKFRLDVAFKSEKKRIGILGASGCGKSLTLKSIAGIERPEKGRIVIDGVTLFDAGKKIFLKPQKRKVGYLFQNYALFPNMTVEQNIALRQRWQIVAVEFVTMCGEYPQSVTAYISIFRHNREVKHHLIDFCVTITTHA